MTDTEATLKFYENLTSALGRHRPEEMEATSMVKVSSRITPEPSHYVWT